MRFFACACAAAVALVVTAPAFPQEKVDYLAVQKIRDEALGQTSQVMETLRQLTDVIGPRLTGSPQLKAANEWTRKQLEDWGMASAHLESWGPFGRGWSFDKSSVTMVSPQGAPLIAIPKAWTRGPMERSAEKSFGRGGSSRKRISKSGKGNSRGRSF